MKKLTYAILLAAISLSFLSGCNSGTDDATFLLPKPGEDVDCVGDFCDQPSEDPVDVYAGPTSVTSTDGTYSDKVGVDWALVTDAVTYNVYRSTSPTGPFTSSQLVASVNAEDCVKDTGVVDPGTVYDGTGETTPVDPTCTNPVMQATYVSDVNLNQENIQWIIFPIFYEKVYGIKVDPMNAYIIKVRIGSSFSTNVSFTSDFLLEKYYSPDDVLNKFRNDLGSRAVCSLVTSGSSMYLRITSSEKIVLENVDDLDLIAQLFGIHVLPTMSPLEKFLMDDARWSTVITANPVQIGCDDSTPPTVTAVSPQSGVADVAPTSSVSVAFSEAINPSTLNETSFLLSAGGTSVAGTVSNGSTFAPLSPLEPGTTYTATITTAVTDLAGNPLAANYTWSFTTSSSSSAGYFYTDTAVSTGERYYYAVTAVNAEGEVSTLSPADEGYALSTDVPGRVEGLAVTSGAYLDRVVLTWQAATGATYYRVYRSDGVATVQIGQDIVGTTIEDTTVAPGIYSYRVVAYNEYGMGGNSDTVAGYRAITDEEFFGEAYIELESALNKMGEVSTKDKIVYDKDGNGSCMYDVIKVSLSEAQANIIFTNYSDFYLTLDGTQETIVQDPLSSSSTGTMQGQIDVSGIYNGYIIFDLELTNFAPSGGTYTIKQTGGTETTLPGTYVP